MMDLSRFEVLSFDCYGTLIDWESGILSAFKPVLTRHGFNLSDQGILQLYAEAESEAEKGEYVKYAQVLREVVRQFGLRLGFAPSLTELDCLARSIGKWEPFADVVPALRALKKKYRLAIISNVDDDLFAFSARRLEVQFDWVITAERVGAYKPSPRVFEHAIRAMGVPALKVLHVAQSIYHDVLPAQALGLATVWVNRKEGEDAFGATPPADGQPDLAMPDIKTLVELTKSGLAGC